MLSHPPDLVLTIHPPALSRDRVYGPLLRRASELASAYTGPTNLGTTALAAVERTEEVVVADNDHGAEAVVLLRGVPADLEPLQIVDTSGRALWRVVPGDVHAGGREFEPIDPSPAALFVVPGRVWVIASGAAVARARALLSDVTAEGSEPPETALASLSLPAAALPQLRRGALASVGAGLLHVNIELMAGSAGLIVGRLAYIDSAAAATAEETLLAVTLAFRHKLEEGILAAEAATPEHGTGADKRAGGLEWLGAAKVERTGDLVVVRAPIPRRWLETLAKAELPEPAP